jgi:hypothetical protein
LLRAVKAPEGLLEKGGRALARWQGSLSSLLLLSLSSGGAVIAASAIASAAAAAAAAGEAVLVVAAAAAAAAAEQESRLVGREGRGVLFFRKGGLAMVARVGNLTCIF